MSASIALGVTSVAANIFGGLSARGAAKKAADRQAQLTYAQRMEEIRRADYQHAFRRGAGRAALGASNVMLTSGSGSRFLKGMDTEHERQRTYALYAARKERRAIKAGARGAGSAFFAQAAGDAIGLAANLYANRTVNANAELGVDDWSDNAPFSAGGEMTGVPDG
jgi:hypothetical protein